MLRLLVVGVERWPQQDEGGDATGGVGDLAGFVFAQGAAQQIGLAVAEPFLDNLVAADGVFPEVGGNVGPEDDVVQIDVVGVVAERLLAWSTAHDIASGVIAYSNG